ARSSIVISSVADPCANSRLFRHNQVGVASDAPAAVVTLAQNAHRVSGHAPWRLALRSQLDLNMVADVGARTEDLDLLHLYTSVNGDAFHASDVGCELRLSKRRAARRHEDDVV